MTDEERKEQVRTLRNMKQFHQEVFWVDRSQDDEQARVVVTKLPMGYLVAIGGYDHVIAMQDILCVETKVI